MELTKRSTWTLKCSCRRSKEEVGDDDTVEGALEEGETITETEVTTSQNIVTSNFTDYNGAEINDLIQCTAPRSIAKSWLTGGMTKEHLENYVLVMINESYDP